MNAECTDTGTDRKKDTIALIEEWISYRKTHQLNHFHAFYRTSHGVHGKLLPYRIQKCISRYVDWSCAFAQIRISMMKSSIGEKCLCVFVCVLRVQNKMSWIHCIHKKQHKIVDIKLSNEDSQHKDKSFSSSNNIHFSASRKLIWS